LAKEEHEPVVDIGSEQGAKWRRWFGWTRQHTASIAIILVLLVFGVAIFFCAGLLGEVEAFSYLGVFLISVISSAVIIIPIPAFAVVFVMGAILNPWLVGLMVGLAEPWGELTAYMAGYSGRVALQNRKVYVKLTDWMKRRGSVVLFLFAAIPNWFFDIVGVAAGALRYPLWKYLLVLFFGKTIKGLIFAFAGYWTLRLVLQHLIG
jgi:membrane protein YqaA with SNARE-associated domain